MGRSRIVLGCISRSEEGRWRLEDSSGAVPLDVSSAQTTDGFFTGEGSSRTGEGLGCLGAGVSDD